jgi:hypothetical protein
VSVKLSCFGVETNLDIRRVFESIDKILRHLDPQIGITAEKPDPAGVSR